jgi:hypothetical protein
MSARRLKPFGNRMLRSLAAAALALLAAPGAAADGDDWENALDEKERLRERIAAVNEGELSFLDQLPDGEVHRHASRIVITGRSLVDGWVLLEQCHERLDRVAAAQILFEPERLRALQVVSFRNMDAAFAEGNTVQLRGIQADAEVCLRAESLALHRLGEGVYELQNGPFMRRFLDGYYPLRLSLRIDYPATLALVDFVPAIQPGFEVTGSPGRIAVEALFEGQLHTRFRFVAP